MKARRLTYWNKLVLYGIFLGIAPLLVLGFFSYSRATSTIQSYVEEGNLQILRQSQFRIEQNLKTVETSVTSLISSLFVDSVLAIPLDGKYYNEFTQLIGSFRQLQAYELGVTNVAFYNMNRKWMVNNQGVYSFEETSGPGEFNPYMEIPQKTVWSTTSSGIRMVTKQPAYDPTPQIVTVVEIPSSHLRKLLLNSSRLGNVFVLDQDMKLLAFQDEAFAQNILSLMGMDSGLGQTQQKSGQLTIQYDNQDFALTFLRSDFNGWTYVSAVSIDVVTKESKEIGEFTLWICAIIILLILIISVLGTNRMYRPIRKLYASIVGEEDESSRFAPNREDELHQIGLRFGSLMDRQQEMTGQIQGHLVQLEQFFVRKLFYGEVRPKEIQDTLTKLRYPLAWQTMQVMAIEVDTLDRSRYEEKDLDLLLFAINNIADELAPAQMKLRPIVLSGCQATILGGHSEEAGWEDRVFKLAEDIQHAVCKYLNITVSIGISREFQEWTDVPKAYKESADALRYRLSLGDEAIIPIRDVLADPPNETSFPVKLTEELKQAVKSTDLEQATALLQQALQELVKQPFHFHDYQFSLIRFLSELGSLLQDHGIPPRMLVNGDQSIVESILKLRTADEVESWFLKAVIEPVLALLEERRSSQFKNISEAVIQMIQDGYDTDLSLEWCADRIGYHPHYVSKVFRQETSVNFGDYLLQYRLNIAKRWLLESDMKVSDISEKLKYTNPQNFIRSFRKVEGITPGQYREQAAKMMSTTITDDWTM